MNLRETAEILGYLSAAYPKHEMFEETVTVWSDQFVHTDFEAAQRAAKRVVAADQWFPTVARFIEILAAETRFKEFDDCADCERGFVYLDNGSVARCVSCRPPLENKKQGRRKELAYSPSDWKEGLREARERLAKS
jgi:hypothetical protein